MNTAHRTARTVALGVIGTAAALSLGTLAGTGTAASAKPATGDVIGEGAPGAIKDSYIVMFDDAAPQAEAVDASAGQLAKRYGGAVEQTFTSSARGFAATDLSSAEAHRLAADPAVAYVEQDRTVTMSATQTDPTWGLDRIDQRSLPLSGSYGYADGGSGVTAYILDTGIRTSHKQFAGRASNGYDFVDKDKVAQDCQGHGTHVAGTVGGATYGVAKNVKLVGVRVLDCRGSGSYSQIIAGVDWVTKNAAKPAVANMSLGGSTSKALDNAVRRSIASGVTYVLAAGNENTDACGKSPARTPEAITVGATDNKDRRASFSNYGKCLDIFAPGVSIVSASRSGDSAKTTMSGTSMAAPHVAGAAAAYLAGQPDASPAQVQQALVDNATTGKVTADRGGSPNKLLYTGS